MNKTEVAKAMKNDEDITNKPQIDLIPSEALWGMAQVFSKGATKYERGNYVKGIEWSRLYNAAMRHMILWNKGQDKDEESGQNHLHHALCNLAMLCYNMENKKELDNRWAKK